MPIYPAEANNILENSEEQDFGENGAAYELWVVKRSFTLVTPICGMGLLIVLVNLVAVDPLFYFRGLWAKNTQYYFLSIWHVVAALYFAAMLVGARFSTSHAARKLLLPVFFVGGASLFAWFGLISWFLAGDLSLFAVALLCMASVFCFPGQLRRVIVVTSALALAAAIYLTDERGTFFSSGVVVNLVAVVAIAFVIDGYMMQTSRALFREKCRVEFERSRADRVLYNALPESIANELKQHRTVKAEKYQRMTVLFTDIVGFTKFSSSVPPDAVVHILNQIFSEFDALVDGYDVEKIKTIGDAYMVVGKGNAAAVADLAVDMLKAMDAYNRANGVDFSLRVGMHIGPTVAGVIGLKRFLYDVWGDAVNTASRMESMGTPGRIHVSEAIFSELGEDYAFEDRGFIEVKGKGSMHTYFLLQRRAT